MENHDARSGGEPSASRVVGLLAIAVFINYVDRGNLATAAPLIKDALKLSNIQLGVLLSAFFWTYTPGQIFASWLAERLNAYRVLAIGLALWSLATALSGVATGFGMLIGLRLLLGLGESASFPCSSKLLAEALPAARLGAANGLIAVGLALGPAVGTFAGGILMAHIGWRAVFILFGLASLFWLLPWFATIRHAAAHAGTTLRGPAPSFVAIGRQRAMWGAFVGHFSCNYSLYFVVSWLPIYLVKMQGFSIVQMSVLGGLVYIGYAISSFLSGRIADIWIASGATVNFVRKTTVCFGHAAVAVCMVVCAVGGAKVAVAGLLLAGLSFGFITPALYAIGQTLAGPRAAGKWIGLQNCIGNIAGVVGPLVTGFIVDRTGQFTWAFTTAGAIAIAGALGWVFIVPKVAPVAWSD